jgi:uncharacterized protein (DUF433 family)
MRFTWDENKRRAKLQKHGFDFADCALVPSGGTLVTKPTPSTQHTDDAWINVLRVEFGSPTLTDEHPELDLTLAGPPVRRIGLKPVPPGPEGEKMRLDWYQSKTPYIRVDPTILGGTPVFTDTLVPLKSLFDCLLARGTLDDFLRDHPAVSREAALAVLTSHMTLFYERISKATASDAMPSSRPR